ncbi:MAG: hypothetical protein ACT4P8_19480, partial [Betaproteobacteria bacterium]
MAAHGFFAAQEFRVFAAHGFLAAQGLPCFDFAARGLAPQGLQGLAAIDPGAVRAAAIKPVVISDLMQDLGSDFIGASWFGCSRCMLFRVVKTGDRCKTLHRHFGDFRGERAAEWARSWRPATAPSWC